MAVDRDSRHIGGALRLVWFSRSESQTERRSFSYFSSPKVIIQDLDSIALAPDGSKLAFIGESADGQKQLWIRPLDSVGAEPLAGTEFHSPPLVEISGSLSFERDRFRPKVIGHAALGRFTYKKAPFSDLTADFSWDGERTLVRDLRVRNQTGQLKADLFDAPSDFRLNIESTISPDAVRPLVSVELNEFLREWQWQRSPAIRLEIRGTDRKPESWQGEGTAALGRTRFRGTWMNSANTKIHFADGALTC